MKKTLFAAVGSLLLLVILAGCGGGSGENSIVTGATDNSSAIDGVPVNSSAGSLTLAWDAPLNSDGTPVTGVAGYSVYYGTSPGTYDRKIDNGNSTTCTINGLGSGTYYLAVTCYDLAGNESPYSNEVSKTVL
ncbi:MAG: hypothetical protein AB9919_07520 [Geobacteraceae bacterium]